MHDTLNETFDTTSQGEYAQEPAIREPGINVLMNGKHYPRYLLDIINDGN